MNSKIRRLDNGIFVMVDDTHLSRWVEQDGRLDHAHAYIDRFKDWIPLGGTVIDCGTSIGDHTVTYASLVGPTGTVLGFEANPDVAECCALNLAPYSWARIHNVGLSDQIGRAGIEISPNVGASHLVSGRREIELAPLDDYTKDLTRCDFIKMDIEGFEVRALLGAKETMRRFHPSFLIEINAGALDRYGFNADYIYQILKDNKYRWRVADGHFGSPQYDILADYAK